GPLTAPRGQLAWKLCITWKFRMLKSGFISIGCKVSVLRGVYVLIAATQNGQQTSPVTGLPGAPRSSLRRARTKATATANRSRRHALRLRDTVPSAGLCRGRGADRVAVGLAAGKPAAALGALADDRGVAAGYRGEPVEQRVDHPLRLFL